MIGNDIVDLQLAKAESNWERKGFLEKVFTISEQALIQSAQHPHLQVWLLWSMKEAAYKAHQRKFSLPRRLNWRDQECQIIRMGPSEAKGLVAIGKNDYSTSSEFTSEVIHTVAQFQCEKAIHSECIPGTSRDSRKNLCFKIARHWSLDPDTLSIQKKPEGIPFITLEEKEVFETFSLSDHGRYSSYAYYL